MKNFWSRKSSSPSWGLSRLNSKASGGFSSQLQLFSHLITKRTIQDMLREKLSWEGDPAACEYIQKRWRELSLWKICEDTLFSSLFSGEVFVLFHPAQDRHISSPAGTFSQGIGHSSSFFLKQISVLSLPHEDIRLEEKKAKLLNPSPDSWSCTIEKQWVHPDYYFYWKNSHPEECFQSRFEFLEHIFQQILLGAEKSMSRFSALFLFSDLFLQSDLSREEIGRILEDMKSKLSHDHIVALEKEARIDVSPLLAQGFQDITSFLWEVMSFLSFIPQSLLMGKSEGALASSSQNAQNYYHFIRGLQEMHLRPFVERVLALLSLEKEFPRQKALPHFEFTPLDFQEKENAKIQHLLATLQMTQSMVRDLVQQHPDSSLLALQEQNVQDLLRRVQTALQSTSSFLA